jgi:hypothetical protein
MLIEVKNIMNSIADDTFTKTTHLSMEEYDGEVFKPQRKS